MGAVIESANVRRSFWRAPNYAAWFTADTASAAGGSLRALAVSLAGYAVSGSTAAAGWLGTSALIAQQVASVFGGTFVDRHERRTLIVANAAFGVCTWGSVAALLAAHTLTYPMLLVIATVGSAVSGFLGSATDAMLRSIIGVRDYPKALSLNRGRDATINIAGNPIGGFLYGIAPWLPFLVTACLYAISGAAARCIDARRLVRADGAADSADARAAHGKQRTSFFGDFVSGWSWSLHKPMLVTIMIAAAILNFGVNGVEYTIQLHLMSLNTNATLIGTIGSGIAAMMLVGAFVAARLSDHMPVGVCICVSFVFLCACIAPMLFAYGDGMSDGASYVLVLIANSVMGLPFPIIDALLLGFVFAKAPTSMQGRIYVSLTVPAQALSAFSSASAGMLLPVLGFRGAVIVFLAALALSTVIVLCSARIRRIPRADGWDTAEL
ncbi:MFS transporter [Bifidobacterium criceti]|uniref:Major facilitator transporter n=1 Tax=Bifidobacterium criceti TaxID=1960969 RepID=A0A2A2EGL3_9BIFI|nr:MFS transporter [Bifidobacterium criceti]PAU68076.1 major facilitator transporter [Bifidobacterium criceti]